RGGGGSATPETRPGDRDPRRGGDGGDRQVDAEPPTGGRGDAGGDWDDEHGDHEEAEAALDAPGRETVVCVEEPRQPLQAVRTPAARARTERGRRRPRVRLRAAPAAPTAPRPPASCRQPQGGPRPPRAHGPPEPPRAPGAPAGGPPPFPPHRSRPRRRRNPTQ